MSPRLLEGSQCVDTCREGTFETSNSIDTGDVMRQCHQCHANCLSCHGRLSTECVSCRLGLSLDESECVLGCGDG